MARRFLRKAIAQGDDMPERGAGNKGGAIREIRIALQQKGMPVCRARCAPTRRKKSTAAGESGTSKPRARRFLTTMTGSEVKDMVVKDRPPLRRKASRGG